MLRATMSSPSQRFWADSTLPHLELRATSDGRALCYGLHSHAEFSVGLIQGGRSVYRNGSEAWAVGPGDLVLMNPGAVHACQASESEQPWAYSMLYVDPVWLAGLQQPEAAGLRALRPVLLRERADLVTAFRRLLHSLDGPEPFEREQLCLDFFSALLAAAGDPAPAEAPARAHDRRLRRAIELLQARYAEPLRLDELARAAGLSPNQLTRVFRAGTGLTPHAYLTDLRLQRSRALLRRSDMPLAEVAAATGFADQAHWQRHWLRRHACTPGAYRRQLRTAGPGR